MELQLSERIAAVKASPTLAVAAKASQLKAQGKDIINLGVGEPDFDTPEHIKQAAIVALQKGYTKYTPVDGIPLLKQAIIDKFKRDNNLHYDMNQILVSVGGKQSIYNLAQAFLNPGDEVLIPTPYWVSYPDIVLLAGAKPVFIQTGIEAQYKITAEQLAAAITPKTKLLFINSPSNPSGVAYSKQELAALAKVLLQHPHVFIATDDMYEHILWNHQPFANIVNACPELYERTIVLNGVSKAYSMTGWRIGYAGGPAKLIAAMNKVQSQSTSNPCSIAQYAAAEALNSSQEQVHVMLKAFKERHDYLVPALLSIDGVQCLPSDGTFYSFPDMSNIIARLPGIHDDIEFSNFLLDKAGIALVPGSAFGNPGCVRFSFAVSMETLQQAIKRMSAAINAHL